MDNGQLVKFNQGEFVDSWPGEYTGFANDGFVHYPSQCADGTKQCKILVMMHGAFQSFDF